MQETRESCRPHMDPGRGKRGFPETFLVTNKRKGHQWCILFAKTFSIFSLANEAMLEITV